MTDLLVMAAGLGSRYGGLKQLERVGPSGETVMDYSLFEARRAGLERVVFVIRRELEAAFRELGDRYRRWLEVDYAFQDLDGLPAGFRVPEGRVKPWGTAQAVLSARDRLKGPFVVINADDYYGQAAFRHLARWGEAEAASRFAMVAFRLENTLSEHGPVARGICRVSPGGDLEGVQEWVSLARAEGGVLGTDEAGRRRLFRGSEPVSMNCWGFTPALFPELEARFRSFLEARRGDPKAEFFLPAVVDALLQEGRAALRVLESPDRWFGVTYPQDKALVERELRTLVGAGAYPSDLWS